MENMNWMRRKFLQASSLLGVGFALNGTAAAQHEGHQMPKPEPKPKSGKPQTEKTLMPEHDHAKMMAEQAKATTGQYVPVQTPDLPKLGYTMDNGVKVFNLRAEVVHCEIMPKTHMGPARKMWAWGYNACHYPNLLSLGAKLRPATKSLSFVIPRSRVSQPGIPSALRFM